MFEEEIRNRPSPKFENFFRLPLTSLLPFRLSGSIESVAIDEQRREPNVALTSGHDPSEAALVNKNQLDYVLPVGIEGTGGLSSFPSCPCEL